MRPRITEKSGYAWLIFIFVIAVAVFFIVLAIFPSSLPAVSVKTNISPESFKVSQKATLTVSLENHQEEKAHDIRIRFVTNPVVHIFLGLNELTKEVPDSGNYTYHLILQPGQKVDQPFVVRVASLPIGIPNQEFSITVEIFVNDVLGPIQEVRFKAEKD